MNILLSADGRMRAMLYKKIAKVTMARDNCLPEKLSRLEKDLSTDTWNFELNTTYGNETAQNALEIYNHVLQVNFYIAQYI